MANVLLSNYQSVSLFQLREAGNRPDKPITHLSTYDLEYFVEYTTFTSNNALCPGIRHAWNVTTDGFPTKGNLLRWARKHEARAHAAGYDFLVTKLSLRRCSTQEVMCEVAPYGP